MEKFENKQMTDNPIILVVQILVYMPTGSDG